MAAGTGGLTMGQKERLPRAPIFRNVARGPILISRAFIWRKRKKNRDNKILG